jgi:hypothetical protein
MNGWPALDDIEQILTKLPSIFSRREQNKGFWPFRVLDKQAMIDRSAELFDELKFETRPRSLDPERTFTHAA